MSTLTCIETEASLAAWPLPEVQHLDDREFADYQRARQALTAVALGSDVAPVARHHRMCTKRLTRLIRLAYEIAPDGLPYGFRPCVRRGVTVRRAVSDVAAVEPPVDARPHAFQRFLDSQPDIALWVREYRGSARGPRLGRSFNALFKRIVAELERQKRHAYYPLNQGDKGLRSLRRYVTRQNQARQSLAMATQATPTSVTRLERLFHLQPFDRFEFDAHRIDVEAKIGVPLPNGGEVRKAITTLWLLAVVDVASRAIIAWTLVIGRGYSSVDVALCWARAMTPWKPRALTLPGLAYPPGAGFPSGLSTATARRRGVLWACDNAKAHHAIAIEQSFCRIHDGVLQFGKSHTPRSRPVIEQLFARLELGGLRQLPGGFEPATKLGDKKIRISNFAPDDCPVQIHWLEEVLEVVAAGYNATPHPEHGHLSPLQFIQRHEALDRWFVESPDNLDAGREMGSVLVPAVVRGCKKTGVTPHVNYAYVRYTSPDLAAAWDFVGSSVLLKINRHDLRTLSLLRSPTEPLGQLRAAPPWDRSLHDETTRRLSYQWIREHKLSLVGVECAIEAYVTAVRRLASSSSQATDQWARLQQKQHKPAPVTPTPAMAADLTTHGADTSRLQPWMSLDDAKD